jgi:hypothetical protein
VYIANIKESMKEKLGRGKNLKREKKAQLIRSKVYLYTDSERREKKS